MVVLREWGLTARTTEDAVLLVSELVGNAVRHTGARAFGLACAAGAAGSGSRSATPPADCPVSCRSRTWTSAAGASFLVDKLADRWGVDLLPRGKTTWFEIA
ncbi:hypothetical protein GCM10023238_14270 [Streptomyces heliomycini]